MSEKEMPNHLRTTAKFANKPNFWKHFKIFNDSQFGKGTKTPSVQTDVVSVPKYLLTTGLVVPSGTNILKLCTTVMKKQCFT